MILYPEGASDIEKKAIDDYWTLSNPDKGTFQETVKVIQERYKHELTGPLIDLTKRSCFVLDTPNFSCKGCGCRLAVTSRTAFLQRLREKQQPVCKTCRDAQFKHDCQEATAVNTQFWQERVFTKTWALESLNFIELLVLAAVLVRSRSSTLLQLVDADDVVDLQITCLPELDEQLIGLIEKRGVVLPLWRVPPTVAKANSVLSKPGSDRLVPVVVAPFDESPFTLPLYVSTGVYLNPHFTSEPSITSITDLTHEVVGRLRSYPLVAHDVATIERLLAQSRAAALSELAEDIADHHGIPMASSAPLMSTMEAAGKQYGVPEINFALHYKASESRRYIKDQGLPRYTAKHIFAKSFVRYINELPSRGWTLDKPKRLSDPYEASTLFDELFISLFFDSEDFLFRGIPVNEFVTEWARRVGFAKDSSGTWVELPSPGV
ncbi:MAG: hypothetical protein AWU57_284 [Marinobacter sp. T13-3]|nr:MAG: hypothetical protein AWU57_284 [Marinobacter sp. T13-3]